MKPASANTLWKRTIKTRMAMLDIPSQAALARKMDIPATTMSHYVNDLYAVPFPMIKRIAAFLRFSDDEKLMLFKQ